MAVEEPTPTLTSVARTYDDIDRFLLFVEQLEEAREQLLAGTVVKSRMAIILLDNLASILLLADARGLFDASEGSWWMKMRRFPGKERRRIENDFSRQVTLAATDFDAPIFARPERLLDDGDAATMRIAHQYRNPIYHEDRHNPALLPLLGRLYLAAVARAFAQSYPSMGVGFPGIEQRVAPLQRFGIDPLDVEEFGGRSFWHGAVAKALVPKLTADLQVDLAEARGVLADDLRLRTETARESLQDLLSDGMEPDRLLFIFRWSQFWEEHGADEGLLALDEERLGPLRADLKDGPRRAPISDSQRASMEEAEQRYIRRIRDLQHDFQPRVTLETLPKTEAAAGRLARARSMTALLQRYRDLDLDLNRFETCVDEAARAWDKLVQDEIDRRRGK
jgi:hypothetical protein